MMTRIKMRLFLLITVLLSFLQHQSMAQSNLATVQQIMNSIYQVYDSADHLTFDFKYIYTSIILPDGNGSQEDGLSGTYTMAGNKAKYNLGEIDFMQNDSFFIAVYNKEKYILVSDPRPTGAGGGLPARQVIDSMLQAYSSHYNITLTHVFNVSGMDSTNPGGDTTTTGIITFEKADSLAQFLHFTIIYDSAAKFLTSIEYVFEEPYYDDSSTTLLSTPPPPSTTPQVLQKTLRINFSDYRYNNFSSALYDEEQYIYFEDDTWKPVEKYKDYRLFNSWTGGRQVQYAPPAQ
ncbi:MAG: hypothetical protein QM791_22455 [Ferruginibacter sp.]